MIKVRISHVKVISGYLLISACATIPAPEPKIVEKRVEVPIPVACIDKSKVPAEPGEVSVPSDARQAADVAGAQAKTLRVWGRGLLAIMSPCYKP